MYKQSVLVSPNFNCSTEIQMFTGLISTSCRWSERQIRNQYRCDIDSGTWQQYSGGTQQQLPKSNKTTSSVEHGENEYIINLCIGLTGARPSYWYLMTVLSFVCISIHHHHNEQQDGKLYRCWSVFKRVLFYTIALHQYTFLLPFRMYYFANMGVPALFIQINKLSTFTYNRQLCHLILFSS